MTTTFLRDAATGQVLFDSSGYPRIDATLSNPNTYGVLKTRVGNEVLGAVTNDDVAMAVQDAIAEYERQDFWFSEMRFYGVTGSDSALTTVPGKEFYAQGDMLTLPNWSHISKIMVLAFNNRYTLRERTPQWIDDQSISPTWQGLPTDWSWSSGALRLYLDGGLHRDIYPHAGTLLLFLSAQFEHEVLPATHDRMSIACWMRQRTFGVIG